MALVACRECRRNVSTEAPNCPHCGVPDPAREYREEIEEAERQLEARRGEQTRPTEHDAAPVPAPPPTTEAAWARKAKRGGAWALTGLLGFLGLLTLFGSFSAGLCLLAIAALYSPPLVDKLALNAPRILAHRRWVVLGFVVLMLIGIDSSSALDEEEPRDERDLATQQRLDSLAQYVRANRTTILSKANEIADTGSDQAAAAFLHGFQSAGDSAIAAAQASYNSRAAADRAVERERQILDELRSIPSSDAARNSRLYAELARLKPDNARYRERADHYGTIVQREVAERNRLAALRGQMPQASAWDGSYREVERYLERVMNDPRSLEMDGCTQVYTVDEGWLVGCDYRGSNAFGGIVRQSNWFIIRQGRVVDMLPASAYNP